MLHLVLYGLLAVILAAGLFLVASRFLPAGEQIAPPLRDEPPWSLPPERSLHPEDVDSVRLPVALRGYRFAETDILLDRLATELRARDAEISRLRGGGAMPALAPPAFGASPAAPPDESDESDPVGSANPYAPPPDAAALSSFAPPPSVPESTETDETTGAVGTTDGDPSPSEQTGGNDRS